MYVLVSVKEVSPYVLFFHTWLAASELIKMDITPCLKAFNGFPLRHNYGPNPHWLQCYCPRQLSSFTWLRTQHLCSVLQPCWSDFSDPAPFAPGPLHWWFPLPWMLFLPPCQVRSSSSSASVWSSFLGKLMLAYLTNTFPTLWTSAVLHLLHLQYYIYLHIFWLMSASLSSPLPSLYLALCLTRSQYSEKCWRSELVC